MNVSWQLFLTSMCLQQLNSYKLHKKPKLSLELPKNIITSMQPQQCILYFEQISDCTDTDIHTALIFRTQTDMPADSGDVLCVPVWNSICSECWQIGREILADNNRFPQLVTISFRQQITKGDYMTLQRELFYAPLGYTWWSLRAPVNKHWY